MAWIVRLTDRAENELAKLDKTVAVRIERYLRERLQAHPDPRVLGRKLEGSELG